MRGRVERALKAAAAAAIAMVCAGCTQEGAEQQEETNSVGETGVASEISGVAVVVDGDTIRIGGTQIRFDGIDAPEEGAMCGDTNMDRAATNALSAITRNARVSCRVSELPDEQGRTIAQCHAGDIDLNAYMVANGWARDWPRYSDGAYADEEAEARAARRGVWGPDCAGELWTRGRDYSRTER